MCSIDFRVFAFSCTVSREWKSLKNCVWGTFHSYFSTLLEKGSLTRFFSSKNWSRMKLKLKVSTIHAFYSTFSQPFVRYYTLSPQKEQYAESTLFGSMRKLLRCQLIFWEKATIEDKKCISGS